MSIPEFSIRHRVTTTMLILVIVVVGYVAFKELGLELFPEIEYPQLTIITELKGASSEDVESLITKHIEGWAARVNKVRKVRSISQEGLSIVIVEFEWDTNLDAAAQDIRERISLFKEVLPEEARSPVIYKFNISDFPILIYGVTNPHIDQRDLKTIVEKSVAERLERIDGVASVPVFSPKIREIQVLVKKASLESRNLTIEDLILALRMENVSLPGGYIEEEKKDYVLRTKGEFASLEEMGSIFVGLSKEGAPIYLRDVAEIRDGYRETRNMARIQGSEGLIMMVHKGSGANTVSVARQVKREIENLRKGLHPATEFHLVLDMSSFIETMAQRTARTAIMGSLLAVAFIFLFLRSVGTTLTIAMAIPLSVISTFIALYLAGYTFNLITLIGLALGVGMIVDNAVVVIENTYRHIQLGTQRKAAARIGAEEVALAITASTFTTIAVFFPMIFAKGIVAKLAKPLALTLCLSLLASLFVAITIVPMLNSIIIREEKGWRVRYFEKLRAFYERALLFALGKRFIILLSLSCAFLACLVWAIFYMGKEFLPSMDRGFIMLKVRLPLGTPLSETVRVLDTMEHRVREERTIDSFITQAGTESQEQIPSEFSPRGPYEGFLMARLTPLSERGERVDSIVERLRKSFPPYEHVKLENVDVAQVTMGGGPLSPVEIKLFGDDLSLLEQTGLRTIESIKDVEGLRDLRLSLERGRPELTVHVDRERASRLGLKVGQVASLIETYTIGKVATRMRSREEIDVRVNLRPEDRKTCEDVLSLPVTNPLGRKVQLKEVATLLESRGPVRIEREGQMRKVSVLANYFGRDIGGLAEEIRRKIEPIEASLPLGYFLEVGGEYKEMIDSFSTMKWVIAISLLLCYMVMAALFENLFYPFIIMFTIPLSLIGIVVGLSICRVNISLAVLMGFVMLSGIVVNNGIVMVDYVERLRRAGKKSTEALVMGASTRLRPILITSFTTVLGVLPMILSKTEGSEMRIPLGLTLGTGLLSSTILTLFVIPILYSLFSRAEGKAQAVP